MFILYIKANAHVLHDGDAHELHDDGRWIHSAEEFEVPLKNVTDYSEFQLAKFGQPSPPPVLSQVADPRHGTSKLAQDELYCSYLYYGLHISMKIMEDFLRSVHKNTAKNS